MNLFTSQHANRRQKKRNIPKGYASSQKPTQPQSSRERTYRRRLFYAQGVDLDHGFPSHFAYAFNNVN